MVLLQHVDSLCCHSSPFPQLGMKHANGGTMDTVRDTTIDMHADPLKTWSSFSDIPLIIVTRETSCEDDISVLRGPYFDAVEPSLSPHPSVTSSFSTQGNSQPCCQVVSASANFGDWPSDEESEEKNKFARLGSSRFHHRGAKQGSDDCRPLRQYGATQDRDNNDENVSAGSKSLVSSYSPHSLSCRNEEENDYRDQPTTVAKPWEMHRHV
jgi:hypothetical protein